MMQEEKSLLLIDLCARLPYGVKGEINFEQDNFNVFDVEVNHIMPIQDDMVCLYSKDFNGYNLDDFKPYLRPMSSMTEEEKEELLSINDMELKTVGEQFRTGNCGIQDGKYHFNFCLEFDFLLVFQILLD